MYVMSSFQQSNMRLISFYENRSYISHSLLYKSFKIKNILLYNQGLSSHLVPIFNDKQWQ